jgi:hypothetical protein
MKFQELAVFGNRTFEIASLLFGHGILNQCLGILALSASRYDKTKQTWQASEE